ncbi:phage tail protein I [Geobacillus stearothermophilus]|nr:phage tail protein I [Geobacillus stearothermophilus]
MIKLDELRLADILPDSLKKDEVTVALAEAIEHEFQLFLQQIDILNPAAAPPSFALDMVAYEEHVDFYDPALPEQQKRALIANAELVHRRKGTAWAVEEVASIFFKNARLREWFEYDGQPYHFKIETDEDFKNESDIPVLLRLLYANKRKSTRLDAIWFRRSEGTYLKIVHTDRIRIKPVMSFRTGIAMPGGSSQTRARVLPASADGVATPYFTGEIYPGRLNNDTKTGARTASFLMLSQQYANGYSTYHYSPMPLGNATAEKNTGASIVLPRTKNGASTVAFCGKTYAGKRW